MPNPSTNSIWLRVFACLGVVFIACGLKNYLAVLFTGTPVCTYLCPTVFPSDLYFHYPFLESLFETQRWVLEQTQRLADALFPDRWNLTTILLLAPVYEELGLAAVTPATCLPPIADRLDGVFCYGGGVDALVEAFLSRLPDGMRVTLLKSGDGPLGARL